MDVKKSLCADAERGQALIIMVFAMIALLLVAGLAIDGGMVFLERRRMQNSADAAALAGTRLLAAAVCGKQGSDDAAIFAEIRQYAENNGVMNLDNGVAANYVSGEETVLGTVGSGTIPRGATGVSVTVEISRPTHFVTLVGIDEAGAAASALAMTGPPIVAGGLRPFGVPLELVQDLDPDDPDNNWFTISFKHDGGDVTWAGGNVAQHRGWMNMGYVWNQGEAPDFPRAVDDGAGASDLKEWMENGWQGTIYVDCLWGGGCRNGDYIHAKPGTNSSAVCQAPGMIIQVPVYDRTPECEPEIPAPKPACPTQGGGYCYHIVGIASVRITDCQQGQGTIEADLVRMVMGEGIPGFGGGTGYDEGHACDAQTQVVTLWK
jgi:hypothetical protein